MVPALQIAPPLAVLVPVWFPLNMHDSRFTVSALLYIAAPLVVALPFLKCTRLMFTVIAALLL
jgi:hypothetical protein